MSRILFHLTAIAATAFVITILAMVAMVLGDPVAPVNLWFNQHGMTVLLIEVAAVVLLGLAAMTADRRESARNQPDTQSAASTESDGGKSPTSDLN